MIKYKPIFVDDILKQCVANAEANILADLQAVDPNITGINWKHGHPLEIIEELKMLAQGLTTRSMRYPLVALFRDFPEDNKQQIGIYSQPTLNIIIATRTDPNYLSEQRKQKSFAPILYPILLEFLNQVNQSGRFLLKGNDLFNFRQIDHYFWGRESIYGADKNIFNDWIDCIELKDWQLKVYAQQNCGRS